MLQLNWPEMACYVSCCMQIDYDLVDFDDDLVLMIEGLWNKIIECKEAFESKDLTVNFWKAKVMASGSITKDGSSEIKLDQYAFCSLRVMDNSVLYKQCGRWIHSRCAGVKMVTA